MQDDVLVFVAILQAIALLLQFLGVGFWFRSKLEVLFNEKLNETKDRFVSEIRETESRLKKAFEARLAADKAELEERIRFLDEELTSVSDAQREADLQRRLKVLLNAKRVLEDAEKDLKSS